MQYQNAVNSAEVEARPLVVDLDGTLINTDLLLETALAFLARYPQGLQADSVGRGR